MNGFVQVVFFREFALMLDCHARSKQIINRIARHNVNKRKDNDRDQKENRQQQQGSAKDVSPHAFISGSFGHRIQFRFPARF